MTDPHAGAAELAELLRGGAARDELTAAVEGLADPGRAGWAVDLAEDLLELLLEAAVRLERGDWVGAALADERRLGKRARKAVKRAAHALRSRSIDVPLAADTARGGARAPAARRATEARAFMTLPDASGQGLAVLAIAERGGGHLVVQAMVRDGTPGEVQAGTATGRELRELVARMRGDLGPRQVEVPPAWLAAELVAAVRAGRLGDPASLPTWKRLAPHLERVAGDPSDLPEVELSEQERGDARATLLELMGHPAFVAWFPENAVLRTYAERLEVALTSELVVSESQRAEQAREASARTVREHLDDATRAAYAARLELAARLLQLAGDRDNAARARVAADEVRVEPVPRLVEHMLERVLAAGGAERPVPSEEALEERRAPSILLPGQDPGPRGGGIIT